MRHAIEALAPAARSGAEWLANALLQLCVNLGTDWLTTLVGG